MQELVPIRFTRVIERIEWQTPQFYELIPGETYWVPPYTVERLHDAQRSRGEALFEEVAPDYRPRYWQGEDLNGKRALYFADGLLGDQCVHTAVYRQLRRDYPRVDIHAYCNRYSSPNHVLVSHNRDVGHQPRAFRLGFTEAQFEAMDYVITPTNVGAEYRGKSQKSHYELLEEDLNIDITYKFPYLATPGVEFEGVRAIVHSAAVRVVGEKDGGAYSSRFFNGQSVIVQLNSSEAARTPEPSFWVNLLTRLREVLPSHIFGVCADWGYMAEFLRRGGDRIVGLMPFSNKPQEPGAYLSAHGVLHLLRPAALCIAPDSFLMHASAAFDTPCLAVWQDDPETVEECRIPTPESRIKHYEHVGSVGMSESVEEIVNRAWEVKR